MKEIIVSPKAVEELSEQIENCPTFVNLNIGAQETVNYTIPNSARMVMFVFGNSESRMSEYMIYTHSSGTVAIFEVKNGGSVVSVTSNGNNSITVSNTGSNTVRIFYLIFSGTISYVSA